MIRCGVLLQIILFFVKNTSQEYKVGFNDGVSCCPDFENQNLRGDSMKLARSEDGEDLMTLEGHLNVLTELGEGDMIFLELSKETDVGSEPMWSTSLDLCQAIKDEDAPWASLFKAMNIESCPIAKGKYEVASMSLETGFCKDYLNPEFEGSYECIIKMKDSKMDTQSCHRMFIAIADMED